MISDVIRLKGWKAPDLFCFRDIEGMTESLFGLIYFHAFVWQPPWETIF